MNQNTSDIGRHFEKLRNGTVVHTVQVHKLTPFRIIWGARNITRQI